MKIHKFLLNIIIILCLFSCSEKEEKVSLIKEDILELQMIEAYKEGLKEFDNGDVFFAAKKFNEVELLYPQSIWAPRSNLMAAYAFYSSLYFNDAIYELERFLEKYKNHPNTDYAYYLLAICHYNQIVDEKKDFNEILKSKKYFEIIIKEYPNTDFALDSKFKLLLINNILASKEIYIGKYYLSKKKWIPAMNRFKNVIEDYDETDYVQEAIHRLVEINYILGLDVEAKKYASLLGYNYQSSEWYKESYKVFNKNYVNPVSKIKKEKGNKIIRKFKELFK